MSSSLPASADVIVVGCGAAGLSAAIEAADLGAEVLVLESQPESAGSTRRSAGYAVFCETDLEPGSAAELYEDLLHAHHDDHDEALVRRYVEAAPGAYVRLRELGVDFARTFQFAHMHRPWGHEVASEGLNGGAATASNALRGSAASPSPRPRAPGACLSKEAGSPELPSRRQMACVRSSPARA